MATPEDEEKLRLQQYQAIQPKIDLSGGQQLPQAPDTFADQLAKLAVNIQQSPAGGTVTVNQPAPNAALSAVQAMQGGATADQAIGGRTPVMTTTAPVNTLDQNATPDPMATLAENIGKALNQPTTQPTAPVSPEDQAKLYGLEKTKAQDQFYTNLQAEDQRNNARIASQRVAQEFPGQNPSMFPEGLSKLLPSGGKFTALPSGGYAIAGAPNKTARAMASYNPIDYGQYAPTTGELAARQPTIAKLKTRKKRLGQT